MSEKYKKYKFLGYCLVAIAIAPIVTAYALGFMSGCQIEIKGAPEVSNCASGTKDMIESLFFINLIVGPFLILPGLVLIGIAARFSPAQTEGPLVQKYEHTKNIIMRLLIGFTLFLFVLFVLLNTYKHFFS